MGIKATCPNCEDELELCGGGYMTGCSCGELLIERNAER